MAPRGAATHRRHHAGDDDDADPETTLCGAPGVIGGEGDPLRWRGEDNVAAEIEIDCAARDAVVDVALATGAGGGTAKFPATAAFLSTGTRGRAEPLAPLLLAWPHSSRGRRPYADSAKIIEACLCLAERGRRRYTRRRGGEPLPDLGKAPGRERRPVAAHRAATERNRNYLFRSASECGAVLSKRPSGMQRRNAGAVLFKRPSGMQWWNAGAVRFEDVEENQRAWSCSQVRLAALLDDSGVAATARVEVTWRDAPDAKRSAEDRRRDSYARRRRPEVARSRLATRVAGRGGV